MAVRLTSVPAGAVTGSADTVPPSAATTETVYGTGVGSAVGYPVWL